MMVIVALLCAAATNGFADVQRATPGIPAVPIDPITGILERSGGRVFVVATSTDFDISTLQENVVTWRRPSLALTRGTLLGLASSGAYFPRSAPVIRGRGGVQETLQSDLAAVPPMHEVVDAILYLGPPSSITHSRLSRELCADPGYVKMRVERLTEFASFGHDPATAFKAECAAVLQRSRQSDSRQRRYDQAGASATAARRPASP